jgi:hypothetical protein
LRETGLNVLKPHRQTTIATLLEAGNSHRQIERVTGIDRKTIRAYHQRIEQQKSNSPGVATGCTDQIPPPRLSTVSQRDGTLGLFDQDTRWTDGLLHQAT